MSVENNNTWNLGEKTKRGLKKGIETAVLVSVITPKINENLAEEYLDELDFLARTAGAKTVKRFTQRLKHPKRKTYIGEGKMQEIFEYVEANKVNLVIFDDDLSPIQQNVLEEELKVKVVDRSSLILDIFADRAQTAQAKTQVELAQLQYMLPRLRGLWTHLERQRGGIGMRGPGEKEIETDRRIIRDKVSFLKKKLEKIDRQNETRRRQRGELIRVSLVGYTNVGKSTLMNVLAKSQVFAENKLFATLDTTVRKVVLDTMPFLLSDTVGFIRKLPHHLIESFKSTLDEVRESDILLHVVDISHPQFEEQIDVVQKTLVDLKADNKELYFVFNKMDKYRAEMFDDLLEESVKNDLEKELKTKLIDRYQRPAVFISAIDKEGLSELKELLKEGITNQYEIRYPYREKRIW